jgi:hypothetical protein
VTVSAAVIAVIFFLLGRRLYLDAQAPALRNLTVEPVGLVLSLVLLVVSLSLSALVWQRIVFLFGVMPGYKQCFRITFVSSLGKYVPGKVWPYVTQVYLGQRVGIPRDVCLVSSVMFFLAYNFSGLLVFSASLFYWETVPRYAVAAAFVISASCLLLLFSGRCLALFVGAAAYFLRRFRHEWDAKGLSLSAPRRAVGAVMVILAADWIALAAGLYFLVNSFYPISLAEALVVCGTLVVSVIFGVLSFFVPAGLGVREGVQSWMLGNFMPLSIAIIISLVTRLWLTVGELICFAAALRIKEPKLL